MNVLNLKQKLFDIFDTYRYQIFLIFALILILSEIPFYFTNPARGADLFGYISAGNDALNLRDLYINSAFAKNNTWLPIFSFLAIPLALLNNYFGIIATKIIWFSFNYLALIKIIELWYFFIYKKQIHFFKSRAKDFSQNSITLPLIIIFFAIANNFLLLQINLLVILLISLSIKFALINKDFKSAIFLSFAIAIKVMPGIFLVYYVIKKRWLLSFYCLLLTCFLILTPMIFYGYSKFFSLLKMWTEISQNYNLLEMGGPTNQSLYSLLPRIFSPYLTLVNIETLIKLLILIIYLFAFYPILKKLEKFEHSQITILELSLIFIIMILFSPIAWKHYWVALIPASLTAYNVFKNKQFSMFALIFYIMFICTMLVQEITGHEIRALMYYYGTYFFAALFLLLALVITLLTSKDKIDNHV